MSFKIVNNEIDLSNQKITPESLTSNMKTLIFKEFKKLNLSGFFTTSKEPYYSLKLICDGIKKNNHLDELIVSKNALGVSGAKALNDFLINNVNFKHLEIDDAGLGEEGGRIILRSILQSKRKDSFLQNLSIRENLLDSKCSELLSKVIMNHQNTLTRLVLSRNNFFGSDLLLIIRNLKNCNKLQILNLEDNFFHVDTSRLLRKVLGSWRDLQTLILNDCNICKKGITYILESLSKGANPNIEYLSLQYCEIDERGFYLLANIIKKKLKSLNRLEINGNYKINEKCFKKLTKITCVVVTGLNDLVQDDDGDKEEDDDDKKEDDDDRKEDDDDRKEDNDDKKEVNDEKEDDDEKKEDYNNEGEKGEKKKKRKEKKGGPIDKKLLGKREWEGEVNDTKKKKRN